MFPQKIRGRGAQLNPKNRFEKLYIGELPDKDVVFEEDKEKQERKIPTTYFRDDSKTVIAKNDSYDVGFNNSINPYRGCEHGCIYCYARPTHEYLSFSAGIDFETKIMVKENAPELLEKEFNKKSYKPEVLMISGNTDCYQPVEKKLKITRNILKTCLKYRNPVSIITKNALIQRDIDILKQLSEFELVTVTLSITTLNKDLAHKMEPRTSSPVKRLQTIELFARNGIHTGVNVAPIIPGLNDKEIPNILKEASERGAEYAGHIMLRLPYAVKDLFINWVNREFPDRANKIINSIKEIRGGKLNSYEWGKRFSGEGELADAIHSLFEISCRKYGLNEKIFSLNTKNFTNDFTKQLNMF